MSLNRKSFLFTMSCKFHNFILKMLWKSQKKRFKSIGEKSQVLGLPCVQGYEYISIGDNFNCGENVTIEAWDDYYGQQFSPSITIGDNVTMTSRCHLSCTNEIYIGNGVLFGRDVFVSDNSHGSFNKHMLESIPLRRPLISKGKVVISNNVWIGRQTTILSGVTIGENSIIGANSLVNKSIPSNCLAGGIPAKVIKRL